MEIQLVRLIMNSVCMICIFRNVQSRAILVLLSKRPSVCCKKERSPQINPLIVLFDWFVVHLSHFRSFQALGPTYYRILFCSESSSMMDWCPRSVRAWRRPARELKSTLQVVYTWISCSFEPISFISSTRTDLLPHSKQLGVKFYDGLMGQKRTGVSQAR